MSNHVNTKIIPKSLVANKYQIGIIPSTMDDDVPKSIRLPAWIWDAIGRDAEASVRSVNGQIVAILKTYYGRPVPDDIKSRVEETQGRASPSKIDGTVTDGVRRKKK